MGQRPHRKRILDEKGRESSAKPLEPVPTDRNRKRRETAEWNAKNGPVIVRQKEDS